MPPGSRKLLLADDSPTIRKVISLTFADEGLEVIAVGDGVEALRVLEEGAPDIVLADAVMPGLDGYGLCERIKGDARFRHIPVMLLVGAFEPFNEAEARRVGADTFLTKPFQSIRDLVSKVGSLLGGGEQRQEEDDASSTSSSSAHAGERGRAAATGVASGEAPTREADVPAPRHAPEATWPRGEVSREEEQAEGVRDRAASFADIEMDDQMIEARPAEAFGGNTARADSAHVEAEPFGEDAPFNEAEPFGGDETPGFLKMRADLMGEGRAAAVAASAAPHEAEEARPARPDFAARAADAAAADEALLDLGDIDPPGSTDEADDFILDLADDAPSTPARASAAVSETDFFDEPEFAAAHSSADAAGAFAEASHGETAPDQAPRHFSTTPPDAGWAIPSSTASSTADFVTQDEPQTVGSPDAIVSDSFDADAFSGERREDEGASLSPSARAHEFIEPQVVPADIPVPSEVPAEFTDGSVEGDVAKSPAAHDTFRLAEATPSGFESPAETHALDASERRAEGGQRTEGLSSEEVDAIARRVVELMSEKVVREIAWEVVPDLAELLIKRRLDEERR